MLLLNSPNRLAASILNPAVKPAAQHQFFGRWHIEHGLTDGGQTIFCFKMFHFGCCSGVGIDVPTIGDLFHITTTNICWNLYPQQLGDVKHWDIYQPQKVYIPLYPIIVPLFTINIPLNPTKSPLNHPVVVVVLQASNPLVTGLDQGSSTVASPKILLGGFTRNPPTKHEKLD